MGKWAHRAILEGNKDPLIVVFHRYLLSHVEESRQFDVCKQVICETTCSYHYKVWSIFTFFSKITEKCKNAQ